jgi:hypothetical protein
MDCSDARTRKLELGSRVDEDYGRTTHMSYSLALAKEHTNAHNIEPTITTHPLSTRRWHHPTASVHSAKPPGVSSPLATQT